jgi:acyl-CoA synthetase (AMP-forming)/AMP-acid ligase II
MGTAGVRLDQLLASGPRGDEPALYSGDRTWTGAEVGDRADAVAAALRAAGVEPGAAVAVTLDAGADVVPALFGVWQVGGVYVPVNPRSSEDEVARLHGAVGPAAVVTSGGVAGIDRGGRRFDADVALVQMTSGTAGRPKPVLLTHTGVLALLDNVLATLRGGRRGDGGSDGPATPMPNLVPVSLSLWAGIYQVLFAFRAGAAVIVMDRFDTVEFARLVQRHGIRSVVLPPPAMVMLADDDRIDSLAPLRFVRSITAPLSPLQARRFRDRFGIAVLNSYGQTEIGGEIVGWTAADSRAHGDSKLGSAGRPHAGVEIRVSDGGELVVRTPAMSAGYADGDDLSDRLTPDGWFRTGDVGRVDEDGFVWIEGRVSDMINRGGLKVFPAEVEEVLRMAPGVVDAAVVGVPDARLGEVPWAFVVVAPGDSLDLAAVQATCRQHLAPYKLPVRVELVASLPTNEVGKVLRRELLEWAEAAGS